MGLNRKLTLPWQSNAMQNILQSLLLSEMITPSSELWLLSDWVSDIEVIDNRSRAFAGIRPDWPSSRIRLSKVLGSLISVGADICVVMRDVNHNNAFHLQLKEIQRLYPTKLGIAVGDTAREKSIVGDDFVLSGSMNLTHSGLTRNDSYMELRIDKAEAAERRLDLRMRWDKALRWQ